MKQSSKNRKPERPAGFFPKEGDFFNPSPKFCGFWPPDLVGKMPSFLLTDGQKRLYERLVRLSGQKGHCWPSYTSLAYDLGKCERQVKRDMKKLESRNLIRITHRGKQLDNGTGGRDSNAYYFLWRVYFEIQLGWVHSSALNPDDPRVTLMSLNQDGEMSFKGHDLSDTDGRVECLPWQGRVTPESHVLIEKNIVSAIEKNADLDQQLRFHKQRGNEAAELSARPWNSENETLLKIRLKTYRHGAEPTRRVLADVVAVAEKYEAGPGEVFEILENLERSGYGSDDPKGPRSWKWFSVTLEDRLKQDREQKRAFKEQGAAHWSDLKVKPIDEDIAAMGEPF